MEVYFTHFLSLCRILKRFGKWKITSWILKYIYWMGVIRNNNFWEVSCPFKTYWYYILVSCLTFLTPGEHFGDNPVFVKATILNGINLSYVSSFLVVQIWDIFFTHFLLKISIFWLRFLSSKDLLENRIKCFDTFKGDS